MSRDHDPIPNYVSTLISRLEHLEEAEQAEPKRWREHEIGALRFAIDLAEECYPGSVLAGRRLLEDRRRRQAARDQVRR